MCHGMGLTASAVGERITLVWSADPSHTDDGVSRSSRGVRERCLRFNETDRLFEQSCSLAVHDAGLRVAYLPLEVIRHIGEDESAYDINGYERNWFEAGTW